MKKQSFIRGNKLNAIQGYQCFSLNRHQNSIICDRFTAETAVHVQNPKPWEAFTEEYQTLDKTFQPKLSSNNE